MNEQTAIERVKLPRTRQSIAEDLRVLGVREGMTLIVHSSLSSLGWVSGGPVAVVQALMDVLTEAGTLIMPTQSGDYSDPAPWSNPPVPVEWHAMIRETMPAYDPQITPTRGMGKIVETFRTFPGVIRSTHPQLSFAAWGRDKQQVIEQQSLSYPLGEHSPLARIYERDGHVLLLGVDHDNNTSLHLAENRAPGNQIELLGAPILQAGERVWTTFENIVMDADQFLEIGAAFEREHPIQIGLVGSATAKLIPQRELVDFSTQYLTKKRGL
ncbi:aminoglycoside N(3)-acetyltransferase [Tumebacillus lipolyticus]|uniref:Aminoglycoside N(3)-acetyltransferase n=1 Tax=Tumebacillus lipolyticus TaxID=1280370 RepID=A0ABW4ZZM1_9BACL